MSLALEVGDIVKVRSTGVHYEVVRRAGWNTDIVLVPCWKTSKKYPYPNVEEWDISQLEVVHYKGL